MEKKNKDKKPFKERLTVKNLTTTFGTIWFVLVFIFTFFGFSHEFRDKIGIIAAVIFSVIGASFFVWLGLFLWIKKRNKTPNDQNIKEALKKQAEEEIKEQENKEQETKDINK